MVDKTDSLTAAICGLSLDENIRNRDPLDDQVENGVHIGATYDRTRVDATGDIAAEKTDGNKDGLQTATFTNWTTEGILALANCGSLVAILNRMSADDLRYC